VNNVDTDDVKSDGTTGAGDAVVGADARVCGRRDPSEIVPERRGEISDDT
jgi:hypothetical protein